jgi:hypothetical protein
MGLGLVFVTDRREACPGALAIGRIVERGEQRVIIRTR